MNDSQAKYKVRPINWLPIPIQALNKAVEQVIDENDLFPKGEIISYYPFQGYGYLKNIKGQEVIFKLNEISLVGDKADPSFLAVGLKVGYDVSQASDGLHVKTIKVY